MALDFQLSHSLGQIQLSPETDLSRDVHEKLLDVRCTYFAEHLLLDLPHIWDVGVAHSYQLLELPHVFQVRLSTHEVLELAL